MSSMGLQHLAWSDLSQQHPTHSTNSHDGFSSIAVLQHSDQSSLYMKCFTGLTFSRVVIHSSRGWELTAPTVSRKQRAHWELTEVFWNLKATLGSTRPPALPRPHLLSQTKDSTNWGSRIQTHELTGAVLLQTTTEAQHSDQAHLVKMASVFLPDTGGDSAHWWNLTSQRRREGPGHMSHFQVTFENSSSSNHYNFDRKRLSLEKDFSLIEKDFLLLYRFFPPNLTSICWSFEVSRKGNLLFKKYTEGWGQW